MATFSVQCGLQVAYNLESGSISRDAFLFYKGGRKWGGCGGDMTDQAAISQLSVTACPQLTGLTSLLAELERKDPMVCGCLHCDLTLLTTALLYHSQGKLLMHSYARLPLKKPH